MTPEEFITELFGPGWTQEQLPAFLMILQKFDEDSKRYHQVREMMAGNSFINTRKTLHEIDELVDQARRSGAL